MEALEMSNQGNVEEVSGRTKPNTLQRTNNTEIRTHSSGEQSDFEISVEAMSQGELTKDGGLKEKNLEKTTKPMEKVDPSTESSGTTPGAPAAIPPENAAVVPPQNAPVPTSGLPETPSLGLHSPSQTTTTSFTLATNSSIGINSSSYKSATNTQANVNAQTSSSKNEAAAIFSKASHGFCTNIEFSGPPQSFSSQESVEQNIRSQETSSMATPQGSPKGKPGRGVPHVYHDFSQLPGPGPSFVRKKTGGVTQPFPEKLHEMLLYEASDDPSSAIVSWLPHGRAFIVRRPKEFISQIMPKYFRQTKLTSFQRQLNLYGFRRITQGADAGAYYHEMFLQGRPSLSHQMVRQKVKGTGHKQPADVSSEPNFYGMSPVEPERVSDAIPPPPPNVPPTLPVVLPTRNLGDWGITQRSNNGSASLVESANAPGSPCIASLQGAALLHGFAASLANSSASLLGPAIDTIPEGTTATNMNNTKVDIGEETTYSIGKGCKTKTTPTSFLPSSDTTS